MTSKSEQAEPEPRARTAEAIALFRAMESARPAESRLFEDPYAARVLSGPFAAAARLLSMPGGRRILEQFFDWMIPGVRGSAVVRTRLIDDAIHHCRQQGVEQLVILGAGYDTRALRLPGHATTTTYEVDRHGIQRRKIARLSAISPKAEHIRYVALDFDVDDLEVGLREAGLKSAKPTVFILEGVTYYLTRDGVDATLRAVHELSAPASHVVFTYMDRTVIEGKTTRPSSTAKLHVAVRRVGERFTFGLHPHDVAGFLQARGLALLDDVETAHAAKRFFESLHRFDSVAEWEHVATARVDK